MGGKNFIIRNVLKVHALDIAGLEREANRTEKDVQSHPERFHGNVDPNRTHLNRWARVVMDEHGKQSVQWVDGRTSVFALPMSDDGSSWSHTVSCMLDEANRANRRAKQREIKERPDMVWGVSSVYTASHEWFEQHTEEEAMKLFEDCLAFEMQERGTVLNAVVHFDEETPHMHVFTVPLFREKEYETEPIYEEDENGNVRYDEDGKPIPQRYTGEDGKPGRIKYRTTDRVRTDEQGRELARWKMSGKAKCGNKKALSQMQTRLAEQVGAKHGLERGECRFEEGLPAVNGKTTAQMHREQRKELEDTQKKLEAAKKELVEKQRKSQQLTQQAQLYDQRNREIATSTEELRRLDDAYEQVNGTIEKAKKFDEYMREHDDAVIRTTVEAMIETFSRSEVPNDREMGRQLSEYWDNLSVNCDDGMRGSFSDVVKRRAKAMLTRSFEVVRDGVRKLVNALTEQHEQAEKAVNDPALTNTEDWREAYNCRPLVDMPAEQLEQQETDSPQYPPL